MRQVLETVTEDMQIRYPELSEEDWESSAKLEVFQSLADDNVNIESYGSVLDWQMRRYADSNPKVKKMMKRAARTS